MRAEQWMVAGVAAIGIYSVYRLTKADGGTRTAVPVQAPPPLPMQTLAGPSATLQVPSSGTIY